MDIDTNEQLIAFCQEALRIPSYSGQEKGVAELMKRKMEEYGFDEVIIQFEDVTARRAAEQQMPKRYDLLIRAA